MTTRSRIVVTNRIHDEVRLRLESHGAVTVNTTIEPWHADTLADHLADATAMMGFMTDSVDAPLLERARHLKLVACALKGFDSYDVEACTARGVWVSIVPDLLTEPTAELAVGLAIGLARHVLVADSYVRDGGFKGWRPTFYGTGLAGATVAIVGLGKVGSAIAKRLFGFECRLLGVDPAATDAPPDVERVSLDEATARADFVMLAAPLNASTRHLVTADTLSKAKHGSLWINVGRGSVVDEDAIADALSGGAIAGYAADVFAFEDWRLADRPRAIPQSLLSHPATLFTPHLGSAVRSVRLAIEHRAADNILDVLAGRAPRDAINRPEARH
jgi:phosphonate dehydrogenase